jgi:hypothetical protein
LIQVFAGADGQDPAKGLLVILTSESAAAPFREGRYPTPTSSGSIRIVSEEGGLLILETAESVGFKFDVEARRYLQ